MSKTCASELTQSLASNPAHDMGSLPPLHCGVDVEVEVVLLVLVSEYVVLVSVIVVTVAELLELYVVVLLVLTDVLEIVVMVLLVSVTDVTVALVPVPVVSVTEDVVKVGTHVSQRFRHALDTDVPKSLSVQSEAVKRRH